MKKILEKIKKIIKIKKDLPQLQNENARVRSIYYALKANIEE